MFSYSKGELRTFPSLPAMNSNSKPWVLLWCGPQVQTMRGLRRNANLIPGSLQKTLFVFQYQRSNPSMSPTTDYISSFYLLNFDSLGRHTSLNLLFSCLASGVAGFWVCVTVPGSLHKMTGDALQSSGSQVHSSLLTWAQIVLGRGQAWPILGIGVCLAKCVHGTMYYTRSNPSTKMPQPKSLSCDKCLLEGLPNPADPIQFSNGSFKVRLVGGETSSWTWRTELQCTGHCWSKGGWGSCDRLVNAHTCRHTCMHTHTCKYRHTPTQIHS